MCDTVVAVGNSTADGSVIFAKNSDRDPNEAHELLLFPHAVHPAGSRTRCTYVDIPQVRETFAVLLARPFWIWGAEMGANERGVVIGNEAVFTRMPLEKGPGLIGMDFIRLGLERAATARAALDAITSLLAEHGQGGNCGFASPNYYHNSFIIADPSEAWVLETAGRQWAAERVRDVRSISNLLTIGRQWDLASEGLVDEAISRGWCYRREEFDFAACYSDPANQRIGAAQARYCRSGELLHAHQGNITVATMAAVLRDHGAEAGPAWAPSQGPAGATVCMHATRQPVPSGQSIGSLVSHLTSEGQTHWLTGTSAPCTGVFKPVWIDAGLPNLGPRPSGLYDPTALFWRHEVLHRSVLRDYVRRLALYREERDAVETEFVAGAPGHGMSAAERASYTAYCFARANDMLTRWTDRVQSSPLGPAGESLYELGWREINEQAGEMKTALG